MPFYNGNGEIVGADGNYTPYSNMKLATIGDSFTASSGWVTSMATKLGMELVKNVAGGGARWSATADAGTSYSQAQSLDDCELDCILITLGINDCNNNIEIGEIVHSLDENTFDQTKVIGGIQATLVHLQNIHPNALIFVGYTPASGCGYLTKNEPYIDAIKKCALVHGVRYVETRTLGYSAFSESYEDLWESGVPKAGHPAAAAHPVIGNAMAQQLMAQF